MGAVDPADLHGLVDGRLAEERRVATLRRLAASPADRARVEIWQRQNERLRSSFAGIEREPIPAMLDLTAKARLQCIPANDAPLVEPAGGKNTAATRRGRLAAALATVLVISAGLGGSWWLIQTSRLEPSASKSTEAVELSSPGRPESAIETFLPQEATEQGVARLPISEIPDLHAAGFGFTGAETIATPPTIVFRYQNGSDRIAVSVTRARAPTGAGAPSGLTRVPAGYGWTARDTSFALAGTLPTSRLRDIAAALRQATLSR